MNPVEQPTTRIQRDELLRLLDTMTPPEQQTITARTPISEIDAAARAERPIRPFSQVAALLTPVKPPVFAPRPVLVRARTQPGLALSSQVVAQLSAEEIAMLPVAIRPVETPPSPAGDVIDIPSAMDQTLGHSIHLTAPVPTANRSRFPMITSFAALAFLVLCAVYFLAS